MVIDEARLEEFINRFAADFGAGDARIDRGDR
jgi:hypothetical protein